jgi:hypothetical protein
MIRIAAVTIALLLALAPEIVLGQATWLDSPISQWNTPGVQVPMAPPTTNPDPRCRTSERAATLPEETQLTARGWRLESFWPTTSSADIVLIRALAEYDGMCRPFEYNVFGFKGGTYAGTLSPVNMNSRTDGALFAGPIFLPGNLFTADYIRYANSDPLCCPSGGTTRVTYSIQLIRGPVVQVQQIGPRAPIQVPTQLPGTGSLQPSSALPAVPWLLAMLGIGLVTLGGVLTRRR